MNRSLRMVTALAAVGLCGFVGYASASAAPTHPAKPSRPAAVSTAATQLAPAVPQDSFVPISPCRILNTLNGSGLLHAKGVRTFDVYGSAGIGGQGGRSTGCGIPLTASAVTFATTAFKEAGTGYLLAYPTGATRPTARTMSFVKNVTVTSGATVKLGAGTGRVLSIYSSAKTEVSVDVVGYYSAPLEVLTQPGGGAYSGSNHVVSVTNPATGVYEVTFDVDVANCSAVATVYDATAGGLYANTAGFNGNTVSVSVYSLSSTAVPVPVADYAYLTVTC